MTGQRVAPPDPKPGHVAPPATTGGGPLLVTSAGSSLVATDAMQTHLERLDDLARELAVAARSLHAVESRANWSGVPGAPVGARRSDGDLSAALAATRSAQHSSERVAAALRRAIEVYDRAEQEADARADFVASVRGAELGSAVRRALPAVVLLGAAAWLASQLPDPGGQRKQVLQRLFLDNPQLITGTGFVRTVRSFTAGLDEGMSTFAGVPVPLAVLLGMTGVTGVRTSARTLVKVGPLLGVFRETPVTVDRVSTATFAGASATAAPAVGALGRLDRVPEVNQVRVEKYQVPGEEDRYVVYVGPTETFSPIADREPWDLTSNVGGVGGLDVGAFRATELAMNDAGVTSDTPVQFVGYSEGGLVATMLAGSGDWNATGLQSFAAPAGNIELPDGLSGMAVRNTDDFIPMLGGPQIDHHLLQVERQAFAPGTPLPTSEPAPAHERDTYRATAAAVDAATSAQVRQQNTALDAFTADYASRDGATVTVMTYHGQRVPDASTPQLSVVTTEARATEARATAGAR